MIAALTAALEGHHLVGDAGDSGLHSGLTGGKGLLDVGLGSHMRAAALEQGELDAAYLGAGLGLDHLGQHGSQAAQLGMAEAVGGRGLGLGHEGAIGIVDALGHGDHALAGLVVDGLHVGDEAVHVKVDLGQVDEVGAVAGPGGQGGGAGQPASVAAHDLHDGDHAGVIDVGIAMHFHAGGGDELGRGGKAGAVVGAVQVVVDGLGHADDAALIAGLLHVLGDLVAGVHGVVAAVIEKVANVVFFEDLQDTLIISIVLVGVGQLVAAGAQLRRGGIFQQIQLGGILLTHVIEAVLQHTLDAVGSSQHPSDVPIVQCSANYAQRTGVNYRSRTTGLANNARALEFVHSLILPLSVFCVVFVQFFPFLTEKFRYLCTQI